jgi:hypothetical protein
MYSPPGVTYDRAEVGGEQTIPFYFEEVGGNIFQELRKAFENLMQHAGALPGIYSYMPYA